MLTWSAIPAVHYRVQSKNNLDDPNWTNLVPDVVANPTTASFLDPIGANQRFYRVFTRSP